MELVARAIRWGAGQSVVKGCAQAEAQAAARPVIRHSSRPGHGIRGCVALACRLVVRTAQAGGLVRLSLPCLPRTLQVGRVQRPGVGQQRGPVRDHQGGRGVQAQLRAAAGVQGRTRPAGAATGLLQVCSGARVYVLRSSWCAAGVLPCTLATTRPCGAAAGVLQVLSHAHRQPHTLRSTHSHFLSPSLLQGKTYQRQFPQRFAAGSVRECSCCHPLSPLPSPRHPLLRSRVFVLCCWPPLLAALLCPC